MPTVPYNPIPSVSPQPVPRLRRIPQLPSGVPSEAFGGGVASQAGGLGDLSGVQNTAENIAAQQQRIRLEERAKANQVAVTDAASQIVDYSTQALHHPDHGYLNQFGKNAFEESGKADQEFWDVSNVVRNNLKNPEQQDAYDKIAASQFDSFHRQIAEHVAQQRQVYDKESTQAALDALREQTVKSYTDPLTVEPNIAAIGATIRANGQRLGLPDEFVNNQIAQETSQTRLDVLKQYVANGQDLAASAYLQKYRDQFQVKELTQAEALTNHASVEGESQRQADLITGMAPPIGQVAPGNIDLTKRPRVQNSDGSISTVRSISIEQDGKTILIPTVSPDGRVLSDDDAVKLYHQTGQHLGIFANEAAAEREAVRIHDAQAAMLSGQGDGTPTRQATGLLDALQQAAKIQDPNVRDKTEQRVRRYYEDVQAAERQDRAATRERLGQVLERNAGNLDAIRKDPDWVLKLNDTDRTALEHRSEQIRHPVERGNDALSAHWRQMSAMPQTQGAFMAEDFTSSKYAGLSNAQRNWLISRQIYLRQHGSSAAGSSGADKPLMRKQEALVIKQSKDAAQKRAGAAIMEKAAPGSSKYLPPAATVVIPKWMTDSAAHYPEYRDFLKASGVILPDNANAGNVDVNKPTAPRVPGAPIQKPNGARP